MVLHYPKNNLYIQSDNEYGEIFTMLAHNKKLYLINAYCYKKRSYPGIQLILKLKEVVRSALSKTVCEKIVFSKLQF